MKKTLLTSAIALASLASTTGSAQAVELTISCGAVGAELTLCQEGVRAWEEKTGHSVDVVSTPNSSTERLSLYQQILSANSSDIDVMQIDVVWPGLLANHLFDLREVLGDDAAAGHFETIVVNNTIDDRLVAMPWFTDAGVLYYREDLLEKHGHEVPTTWQDLTEIARDIQNAEREAGNSRMQGFVFQGRAYEGLTVNALEWVASFGGGTVVDNDGEVTINNERAAQALDLAASWIGDISPEGVLNYTEEEARGVFQGGNAVFMRNWPYAWALAQSDDSDVRGKVGVVQLPAGGEEGQSAAGLGGWNLAVSRYSEHPDIAADLVAYLTGEEEQKRRAIQASYNPTIDALYQDQEVLEAVPFFGTLYDTFTNAVARPSAPTGGAYGRVSNAFFSTSHDVLSGTKDGAQAVADLEGELLRLKRRNW
ncbi:MULTISPECIES: ABC transporter substrate-binding protein [Halomonadaceae]|jgi:trehalose/maltose transport system substrate-binding protein|uniref:Carbohydrate ABC transporter substrate-binding protein, CUT1 family n=1 Tax=Vreelandella aquamarina TaxID=77097 RepID=A0A1H8K6P6_9GAMM|nr:MULTISPECIES: ABC transporter substrate-binding protein [Halomonas]KTG24877.1 ABC transporter substrate-binding protein [Idiomarina sp. H105]MEC9294815.1 ABC transporter substrate-binding protein [Pseudomonadota bacterium]OAE94358.1 ABC transporter substrate-binding protein [Idiomarina sp. WRN-38]MCD1651905.1 ABC transporter substrate-binding protein [Halomonas axialensis]MCD2086478.1 ABC transporter substrate-binding protein [Halomonas meridiana]